MNILYRSPIPNTIILENVIIQVLLPSCLASRTRLIAERLINLGSLEKSVTKRHRILLTTECY